MSKECKAFIPALSLLNNDYSNALNKEKHNVLRTNHTFDNLMNNCKKSKKFVLKANRIVIKDVLNMKKIITTGIISIFIYGSIRPVNRFAFEIVNIGCDSDFAISRVKCYSLKRNVMISKYASGCD